MPTFIHANGKRFAAGKARSGLTPGYGAVVPNNVTNKLKGTGERARADGTPIPPDSPDSPFRAGVPYHDVHEDVVYRCVTNLNASDGWGTASFWTARLNCNYDDILHFARLGWMDAIVTMDSKVKRFRCRDEIRVREWLNARERERWERIQEKERQEVIAALARPLLTGFSKPKAKLNLSRKNSKR